MHVGQVTRVTVRSVATTLRDFVAARDMDDRQVQQQRRELGRRLLGGLNSLSNSIWLALASGARKRTRGPATESTQWSSPSEVALAGADIR